MEWVRGKTIGYGSFGTVNLVLPKTGLPKSPLMAVKCCETGNSASLENEKQVLDQLGSCPQIIRCFGDDYSVENRGKFYNLFLEYADKGSLADHVKRNGGRLTESDAKRFAKSVLRGLNFVHSKGFVHCDVKLQNVLLFGNGDVKLADFGLAKRNGEKQGRFEIRGTPLNIAPESINGNVYDFAGGYLGTRIGVSTDESTSPGKFKRCFVGFWIGFVNWLSTRRLIGVFAAAGSA
ncbi:hypothetical protein V6N11_049154 [Hibiscus sabdariffa]|uniref:Protein kinase domain-containing protein n=1 Tax=Hibiscus sabdariffa TaxID=183260 RepID=A0ABR2PXD6_9ROSI